jgi:hypothetical protein
MIVLKNYELVIIAFDNKIIALNVSGMTKAEMINSFTVDMLKKITDLKVSKNEEKMAVALAPDDESNARIEIYKIDHNSNTFVSISTIENISSKIEFMDFSEDNYYLMYKDNVTQKCFYDLTNLKKNDTLAIDFDLEWVSEGIKLSEKTAGLDEWCEEDNKFTCLVRAGSRSLIATDEIGTVVPF